MLKDKEFLITVFGGWFGLHKYYEEEYGIGFLYMISFGLFGIGWIFDIWTCFYYKSEEFNNLKNSIKDNTDKCNALNKHIETLKSSYLDFRHTDYGHANYEDNSFWNYRRPQLSRYKEAHNVYNCSLTVCKNAKDQPFKYVCKYFNIKSDEETLSKFEGVLNDFAAAEQGKKLLKSERDSIVAGIGEKIPFLIRKLNSKKLIRKLGFDYIDFSDMYFPRYTFKYISAGGNSSMTCNVIFNVSNLNKFVLYLSELVRFRKSVAGQRALMTTSLREKIKKRDNYTCKICGNSPVNEPNLLLEIDHIIPLSKNGMTTEENLQTLCWKCNRSKGSKVCDSTEM